MSNPSKNFNLKPRSRGFSKSPLPFYPSAHKQGFRKRRPRTAAWSMSLNKPVSFQKRPLILYIFCRRLNLLKLFDDIYAKARQKFAALKPRERDFRNCGAMSST
jgi:hypothetical protein